MNILILGNASDAHAAHLMNAITKLGVNVYYLDTNLFPTQVNISWEPKTEFGSIKLSKDCKLSFQDIHSVFWRSFNGVDIPRLEDINQQEIAFNDSMSLIRTFMKSSPNTHWVNSWEAYQFHKEKPLQLRQVKRLGVKIPETLVTNEVDRVIEFANSHEKLIFKPVYGGAHTQILNASLLQPKRLNLALSISPVTLQEYIPGTNIRSYVIGNSVYAAEIRSKSLDFREDLDACLIPVELPRHVEQQCRDIAKSLYLEWTAIDWRLNPAGEYVFLEANPSPMFIYFEQETGFPITEKLVQLLVG
jgi:glutathione synthase/RimK-type ligase-like ATP-grasp enzyme